MHFIKIMIIRSWAVQWCCITKENLFLAHLLPSESTPHYNYLHHNPHHMWDQRRGSNLAKQYNFKKQKLPGFLSTKMAGGVRLARHQTHLLYCELLYWFRVHSFVVSWAIVRILQTFTAMSFFEDITRLSLCFSFSSGGGAVEAIILKSPKNLLSQQ